MNPEVMSKTQDALTFDSDTGLENTRVLLEFENDSEPCLPDHLSVS